MYYYITLRTGQRRIDILFSEGAKLVSISGSDCEVWRWLEAAIQCSEKIICAGLVYVGNPKCSDCDIYNVLKVPQNFVSLQMKGA